MFFKDGLAICPLRIFIFFGLTVSLCKPQLRDIYQTLSNIAAVKMQDGFKLNHEFRLVQHFSGSCRAARALMLSSSPGARLLMSVDDIDVTNCRRLRNTKIGWVAFICLCTPILISFLGELGGEFGISFFIPTIWTSFSIANTFFLAFNSGLFISFWVIVGLILLNKLGCFDKYKKELMIYDEFKFINKTWKRCKNVSQKFRSMLSIKKPFLMIKSFFYYSCSRKIKLSDSKKNIWKNINREYYNHGLVLKQSNLEAINIKTLKTFDATVELPEMVSSMIPKGFSSCWGKKKDTLSHLINKYMWKAYETAQVPHEFVSTKKENASEEEEEVKDLFATENSINLLNNSEHLSEVIEAFQVIDKVENINKDNNTSEESKKLISEYLSYKNRKIQIVEKNKESDFDLLTYIQSTISFYPQENSNVVNLSEHWKEVKSSDENI